ncbi:thioredoxin domain-containing protein [Actinospongicola halichondriae]|uniref:thioredoxin domain-containing protein n=1 Tax=Actinospongicola halichondriae TaxID=3236844 RepID=UPI003D4B202C
MNRLAQESSPYLRQHADNPVDWWPWGPEATAEAERRDVPILLSVGYSACHWCHVMAHESFEDEATASVMNELFVNVKVDREERPDVDAVYMDAVQAMTGRGGWPMTVFLHHDGRPFYGGTYFPPEARHGTPAFVDLLTAIGDAWRHRRPELLEQADQLTATLGRGGRIGAGDDIVGPSVLDDAAAHLREHHDDEWGGFGGAPKFPTPQNLDFLIRVLGRTNSDSDRTMVETSLDAMASGGMYDHLGGGFSRYSVDPHWVVPHFEKMLHDQAGLLRLYVHGFQETGHDRYAQIATEIVTYVLRDLRLDGGGIASAEDADSLDPTGKSVEGEFYAFTPDEIRAAVGEEHAETALTFWEFDRPANFDGRWIPVRTHHRGQWERTPDVDVARQRLLAHREARSRPGLDDKVLTEWNGLWIAALAEAGAALDRSDWVDAAVESAQFLLDHLRRDDGRWLRSWQADTGARHLAFASDHAAMIDAFTRLSEATGEARWILGARDTADRMLALFWDDANGGLFTTGHDGEVLVARDKDLQDGAIPSANSNAALALLRLAALTGDDTYRERAESILRLVGALAREAPSGFGVLLAALDLHHRGITQIVIVGERHDLVDVVHHRHLPNAVIAWGEPYPSPLWTDRPPGAAYVCRDYTCGLPAHTVDDLRSQLD